MTIPGQRFGRLTVTVGGGTWTTARCDCGVVRRYRASNLQSGRTQSCGCLSREINGRLHKTHGEAHGSALTPEYRAWRNMITRCENPRAPGYQKYGSRGIAVCKRWRDAYDRFLFDMGRRPSSAHSLGRLDNDGPYAPDNCAWQTTREQARNRRSSRRVPYGGAERLLIALCEERAIPYKLVVRRLADGWSIERALHGSHP